MIYFNLETSKQNVKSIVIIYYYKVSQTVLTNLLCQVTSNLNDELSLNEGSMRTEKLWVVLHFKIFWYAVDSFDNMCQGKWKKAVAVFWSS